jgi:pimeloyl-ACP methyl ester carboxylesterase
MAAVDADPGQLHFVTFGDGRPIIALHGFGATSYSWRHLVPAMAGRGKLFLFDLKGHGASPCPPDRKYSLRDHVDLILAFIRKNDMRDLALIGHSLGGGVALLVAIELVKKGEGRLSSLVLVDSLVFPERLPLFVRIAMRLRLLGYAVHWVLPAKLIVRIVLSLVCAHPERIPEDAVNAYAVNVERTDHVRALIETAGHLVKHDFAWVESKYQLVDVPTLIVWGRRDSLVPLAIGSRLHAGLRQSQLVTVEDCGHIPHEERPEAIVGTIAAFVTERTGPPS